MIILDTDVFSLFELEESPENVRVRSRIAQLDPPPIVATTVVTYEEQSRGRLAALTKSRKSDDVLAAYLHLRQHIANYRKVRMLDFDAGALAQYDRFLDRGYRIGTLDLRIAAIAMSRNALLLSRNLRDFRRIEGLQVEDWTLP